MTNFEKLALEEYENCLFDFQSGFDIQWFVDLQEMYEEEENYEAAQGVKMFLTMQKLLKEVKVDFYYGVQED